MYTNVKLKLDVRKKKETNTHTEMFNTSGSDVEEFEYQSGSRKVRKLKREKRMFYLLNIFLDC